MANVTQEWLTELLETEAETLAGGIGPIRENHDSSNRLTNLS